MYNILVTGSKGQVGSSLKEISSDYDYNFFFTDRTNINLFDENELKMFIESNKIDVIINCAAYTAVDKAETDAENADKDNHILVKCIADIAKNRGVKLIHISSDYVFDGHNYKPYTESDPTHPTSVYGKTKLDGEKALVNINPKNSIIIRTSWIYSSYGHNFVKTMLKLAEEKEYINVVSDQIGTPTSAKSLASCILDILPKVENKDVEIYNYSNDGTVSWYSFAKEIKYLIKSNCKINAIESKDYPTAASRPFYSILSKTKIQEKFGINIPYWKGPLAECIKQIQEEK